LQKINIGVAFGKHHAHIGLIIAMFHWSRWRWCRL